MNQFLEYINEGRNIKAMVIFPNLSVACDAVKAGFPYEGNSNAVSGKPYDDQKPLGLFQ